MGEPRTNRRQVRVYADTSVFGGAFDKEFRGPTDVFFRQVRQGFFKLILSAVLRREIRGAPPRVQELYRQILPLAENSAMDPQTVRLARAYLRAGIVTDHSRDDALHVAWATVSGCEAIVSWNFRHIVHFQKIPLYNEVNRSNGYSTIEICSPPEVIRYEDEEEGI